MTKITVITVCYNESPERIHNTLESIIKQDYTDIELIVVDGGSGIETLLALKEYRENIRCLISEPDDGLYDAMNKGVRLATGEWVIFMNVGDRFHAQNTLTKMMSETSTEETDIVYGDILIDGKYYSSAPSRLTRYYFCHQAICHQAILCRRSVFDAIGMFDIGYTLISDREWIFRAFKKGYRFSHAPILICDWELGGKCANYMTQDQELLKYSHKYFSRLERILYAAIWSLTKILRRIKSSNFAIPVRLKDKRKQFQRVGNTKK